MKKSLFVTVIVTIACGLLWISFLAATHRGPVFDAGDMVKVQGGVMTDPSQPGREIVVAPFLIDKYEVTNAQYKRFNPAHTFPEQHDDFPVTGIIWEEAAAYAKAAGKELPTEAEWMFAAGIADGRRYVWGNEKRPPKTQSATDIERVGIRRDNVSPYGCFDMEGNVWEWMIDELPAQGPSDIPQKDLPAKKILKGGWKKLKKSIATAQLKDRLTLDPETRSPSVGLRCVRRLGR